MADPKYISRPETRELIEQVVHKSVVDTLISLGFSPEKPLEVQKDMQFLRELRSANEAVKRISLKTAIGLIVTATGTLIVLGIRSWVLKR